METRARLAEHVRYCWPFLAEVHVNGRPSSNIVLGVSDESDQHPTWKLTAFVVGHLKAHKRTQIFGPCRLQVGGENDSMTSYRLRPRVARLLRAVTGPLYLPLRALFVRATHSVWSPDIVLDYWRNPETRDHDNDPQHYLQGAQRSGFLLNLIRANVPTDARVLEVGCK